jgi:hypothetical protein
MNPPSYPSRSTTLHAETLGDEWHIAEYTPAFPFPVGAQVYAKQRGRARHLIPIPLDHETKEFAFQHAGARTTDKTPTGILKTISYAGLITMNTAFGNWGSIYVTLDNGTHWVTGYELRRFHALRNMKERVTSVRLDMPAV